MRILKILLPNLTISLNLTTAVVLYLDRRNPMMGFLMGWPFPVLMAATVICSIVTALIAYTGWRKYRDTKKNTQICAKNCE